MSTSPPQPGKDPVAFLEDCLKHFDQQHIQGYTATLHKQERIGGQLQPREVIEMFVREHPRAIFMRWLQGARGADRALYVPGENDGKILVHPTGIVGYFLSSAALAPDSPRVRGASRFGIQQAGLEHTLERTLAAWRLTQSTGNGQLDYLGVVKVPAAGDHPCYALRRTTTESSDGVSETTVYIDKDTLFQVGTVLKGPDGELVGSYFYTDIVLNPAFAPDQFEAGAVSK